MKGNNAAQQDHGIQIDESDENYVIFGRILRNFEHAQYQDYGHRKWMETL